MWQKTSLEKTIFSLCSTYADENRLLHMDNFYNSLQITEKLLEKKIHVNGTIRRNRGITNEIMNIVPAKIALYTKK